jgi:hypothetical protein
MSAPARIPQSSPPDLIAFVEALARAHVTRDIAALRSIEETSLADRHLRSLQQR